MLGTWEESTKSLLRETSAQAVRIVDVCLNALFGWFPGFQSSKTTRERPSAWQSWWAENRQSTFNAIIEDRDTTLKAGAEDESSRTKQQGIPQLSFCPAYVCIFACLCYISATLQVARGEAATMYRLWITSCSLGPHSRNLYPQMWTPAPPTISANLTMGRRSSMSNACPLQKSSNGMAVNCLTDQLVRCWLQSRHPVM